MLELKERKGYTLDGLAKAVSSRERSMSWDTVRELYPTIPYGTIRRRATQNRPGATIRSPGPPTVLFKEIKEDFQTCIVGMQQKGIPVTRPMVPSKLNEAYRVLYSPERSDGILGDG